MVAPKTKRKIVFVRGGYDACAYYRMVLPYKALKQNGYNIIIDPEDIDFVNADVLVFQRQHDETAIQKIIKWKNRGKKIVLDFDDNLFLIEPDNPAKKIYDSTALKLMEIVLSIADAVTVTVKPLADSYSRFNKNIVILPNCIDENVPRTKAEKSQKTVIGWQGSPTHFGDLKEIKSVINELGRTYAFDLVLAGFNPKGMFARSTCRPWIRFSDNLDHYGLFSDFDIGLCPLKNTPFNECKSDIKFLEYASLEIPTIASKIITYGNIKHGETGYVARNYSDWKNHLSALLSDRKRREEIGKAAKEYVLAERTIQKNIWRWEELFNNL